MRSPLLFLLTACGAPAAGPTKVHTLLRDQDGLRAWYDVSWSGGALGLDPIAGWPAVDGAAASTACGDTPGWVQTDGAGQPSFAADASRDASQPLVSPDPADPLGPESLAITPVVGRFIQVDGALWGDDPRGGVLAWSEDGWASAVTDAWVRRSAELRAPPVRQWLTPTALHALFDVPTTNPDADTVQRLTSIRLPTPEAMRTLDLDHARSGSLTPIAWLDEAGTAWWVELERSVRDARDTQLLFDAVLHRDTGGGWQEVDRILAVGQLGAPTDRAALADTWAAVPVLALAEDGSGDAPALLIADAEGGTLTVLRTGDVSIPQALSGLDLCVVRAVGAP